MAGLRYMDGGATLVFDEEHCVNCGMCEVVCPHGVFGMSTGQAADSPDARADESPDNGGEGSPDNGVEVVTKARMELVDEGACMECGACARNCPVSAIHVRAGVGCAAYIVNGLLGVTGDGLCCCAPPPPGASGCAESSPSPSSASGCCASPPPPPGASGCCASSPSPSSASGEQRDDE